MSYIVRKEVEFDAGHRVPRHESQCRNPHGHRYRVQVAVEGQLREHGAATGMVLDFGDVKALLTRHVHDVYDHGFIVWDGDADMRVALAEHDWKVIAVPWHPTAENMARAIYDELEAPIEALDARLCEVLVWETPTSVARYGE